MQWALWAAGKHVAEIGFDAAEHLAAGLGWVVRDHQITYRAAALAGDAIVVRTWIADVRKYAVTRKFIIARGADQTILARGETRWVYADLHRHKALLIPPELTKRMEIDPTPEPPWSA